MIEATQVIEKLILEITQHPEMKHRIILKAIKTAESREVQKAIREFCRSSFSDK